jgi:Aerotolerance regulator N-terminal
MQFLYPTFLWALLALAIPIIIHLFSFRRYRKVFFTNVRFLKEIKEETSSRQKIKNLLVLAARCLAVLGLVFAFAQPFLPQQDKVLQGERSVSIFVDNSFSMNALSQDIPLFEKAKQRAREIVQAYAPDDRFQILTNDFEGRHQRLISKEDALALIDEIKPSPASREFSKVMQRQQQALNLGKAPNKIAYILSDFQKNVSDFSAYKDTSMQVNLIPLQAVQEKNIAIDSAWFEAPVQMLNQVSQMVVKVRNYSTEPAENVRVTLKHNGQEKPVGTFNIPAKSVVTDTVNITILNTGWHEATLTLSDYPVQFDDSYNFAFYVAEQINILTINDNLPNKYLGAAFGSSSYFKITDQNSKNIDYSKLAQYQLIVLNETTNISSGLAAELNTYAKNGGNVLLFPNGSGNATAYKTVLDIFRANEFSGFDNSERQVSTINTEEFVFNSVFVNKTDNLKLPTTKGNFRMGNISARGGEALMTYRDGSVFLQKYNVEKGNFYVCAAPLDERFSNLSKSGEIFVPMLYKMAIATAKSPQIAYTIGKDEFVEAEARVTAGESTYKMKGKNEEFIPDQKTISSKVILGVNEGTREADFYSLYINPQEIIAKYAFNFDRKESDLQYFTKEDLAQNTNKNLSVIDANEKANFTDLVGERSQGIALWRWFIILALVALAIEQLLLRFWK